jgi:hypothetical protein
MGRRPRPSELFGLLSDRRAFGFALLEGNTKTPSVRGQSIMGKCSTVTVMLNHGHGLPSLSILLVGEGVSSTSPSTYELTSSPLGIKLGNYKS